VPSTAAGVTTTVVTIPSFTYKGFTISGTVTAQQSGTLQKIAFNPTAVTAIAGTSCTPAATNPCRIEIIATSHVANFPARKPTGGYPAGVFMAGFFTGTQAAKPNGDTISMTAEASGLKEAASSHPITIDDNDALNKAVINATPGTTGDTAVSLPSSCTGSPACLFTATSLVKSFNSQITETVQQVCETGSPSCLTRLSTKVNIRFTNTSTTNVHKVTLPGGAVHVNPPTENNNPIDVLLENSYRQFSSISWQRLFVHNSEFTVNGSFTLSDQSPGVSADNEEVYLNINNLLDNAKKFELFIPQNSFKKLQGGSQFNFTGKAVGHAGDQPDVTLSVAAKFTRVSTSPEKWTFDATVKGINLKQVVTPPPGPTSVELILVGDGGDKGKSNVIAEIASD